MDSQLSFFKSQRPIKFPIVGYAPALLSDPLEFFQSMFLKHGEQFSFELFKRELHLVADRKSFQECLVEKSKIYGFPDLYGNLNAVIGDGITATPDGPQWKKKRLMLQPRFGPRTINKFLDHFVMTAKDAVRTINSADGQKTGSFTHAHSMDIALKNIFSCLFSQESLDSSVLGDFREISMIIGKSFWMPGKLFASNLTSSGRSLAKHVKMLNSLIAEMLVNRRSLAPSERPDDLLEFLLNAKDSETSQNLTDEQVRDEVLNTIFAGYETTACLISWTLILLAKNPSALAKIQEEILSIGELKTPDDFAKCTTIRATLNESMRMYPPVWLMIRQANQSDSLNGRKIQSGALILLCNYLTHRNQREWSQPEEFIPDRFLDEGAARKFSFFPFGHGPRHCLGNHFAIHEVTALIFYLIRDLNLQPIDTIPKPVALITLQPPMDFSISFSSVRHEFLN